MVPRIQHLAWIWITLPIIFTSGLSDENPSDVVPVVIDTDGGADDALGIFLFLWHEENNRSADWDSAFKTHTPMREALMKLVALTTVSGNTGLQNATRNIRTTLEVAGRMDIPVYAGASTGLKGARENDDYFGYDGFGDFLPPEQIALMANEAVDRLVELANKYDGLLNIICLGPLSNIALAQRKDPRFLRKIKSIHMMGGSVNGYGNVKPGVEFNMYQDPEAGDIVFREFGRNITIMPYDPTVMNKISLKWRQNVLGKLNSTRINFLNMAERKSITKLSFWSAPDPQAVATALWPKLISKSLLTHAVVETGGEYARGAMLVEHLMTGPYSSGQNVHLIEEINKSYYQQLLLLAFKD